MVNSTAQRILSLFDSVQKWSVNNHLASFTKVLSYFLNHCVNVFANIFSNTLKKFCQIIFWADINQLSLIRFKKIVFVSFSIFIITVALLLFFLNINTNKMTHFCTMEIAWDFFLQKKFLFFSFFIPFTERNRECYEHLSSQVKTLKLIIMSCHLPIRGQRKQQKNVFKICFEMTTSPQHFYSTRKKSNLKM